MGGEGGTDAARPVRQELRPGLSLAAGCSLVSCNCQASYGSHNLMHLILTLVLMGQQSERDFRPHDTTGKKNVTDWQHAHTARSLSHKLSSPSTRLLSPQPAARKTASLTP